MRMSICEAAHQVAAAHPMQSSSDLLRTLVACREREEAEAVTGSLVGLFGFRYFSYVVPDLSRSGDDNHSSGMLLTSYPADWYNRYRRRSYQAEDPVIVEGRRELLPFTWGDEAYLRSICPSARRLFFEAREFDIGSGLTIPVHGPSGQSALFSVAGPEPGRRLADVANADVVTLLAVAQCLHANVVQRASRRSAGPTVRLSEQERICLLWTTQGKTAWEIAQIIGRSKATVDFHIRRATAKLTAANKVHAAFKAAQLDLL